MRTLLTYVELARPLNGLIAFISTWLGGIFAIGSTLSSFSNVKLLYVSIASLLLLSAGNTINDCCDYNIDCHNRPDRPLPSGRIRRGNALIFAITLIGLGIVLGVLVNLYAVSVAILVSILLVSYALILKRTPVLGNLVVGILTSLTFISGGIAVGSVRSTIIPAIFAFLFTTAREIVKDLEDTEGDKRENVKTLANLNPRLAIIITLSLIFSVIIFSPIPYLLGLYPWQYLVTIILGVDLVLIYLGIQLVKNVSKDGYAKIQRWMKWDIFVGLGAIYFGIIY